MHVNIYTHTEFTWTFLIWSDNASSKGQRWPQQKSQHQEKEVLFELLITVFQDTPHPQNIQVIDVALGCHP